jgi:outer membrane protein assembly factor BamB
MTDGKSDLFVGLDSATGEERWRLPLGRTRRRGKEGAPPGPLSTPALDDENGYCQSLDGRFVCVDLRSGALRWEVEVARLFGAYQPGYGFAGSPLLLKDQVVLMPAGSRSASVVALDRTTGAVRWKARLDDATEYVSATFLERGKDSQIIAQVGSVIAGLSPEDGSQRWRLEGVDGGLWTPSVLSGGRVFVPTAGMVRTLEPLVSSVREIWRSEVFEGVMGPVVEVGSWLVGHHKKRLTAVEVSTGRQVWQRSEETDGQLIVVDGRLVFLQDRVGMLQVLEVDREGTRVVAERNVIPPARIEAPLAYAEGRVFIRTLSELVALRLGPGK